MRLKTRQLHEKFINSLGGDVIKSSDKSIKPLELDLKPPLPSKARLYIYNMTDPPGGRTLGEMKIQLILPGHKDGNRAEFDTSDGRVILLVGYNKSTDVFVLWDAGMYHDISYSRNVQVYTQTINAAIAGEIAEQRRKLRGEGWEVSIAVRSDNLKCGIEQRIKKTIERVLGEIK